MIKPSNYDNCESIGSSLLPIPLLMAYQPITFNSTSYPVKIKHVEEILRYSDHNCEPETPILYSPNSIFKLVGYQNNFTHDEFDLVNELRQTISESLGKDFDRPIKPLSNLLAQTGPFRVVSSIASSLSSETPISLFEIGPGVGYLGALSAYIGANYYSFDVTQSLYIWQNYLFSKISKNKFIDTFQDNKFHPNPSFNNIHLPWWQYVNFLDNCSLNVDIVYSNSNLGEMSPTALMIALNISKKMLEKSKIGLFYYFSTGMTSQNSEKQISAAFVAAGFKLIFTSPFIAYIPEDKDPTEIVNLFSSGIPRHNPSNRGGHIYANEMMSLKRSQAPLDASIAQWLYGFVPPFID